MARKTVPVVTLGLGLSIAILRAIRGWDQKHLAREAGIRPASISEYESGKRLPALRTLRKILDALDFSLADLEDAQRFVAAKLAGHPWRPAAGMLTEGLTERMAAGVEEAATRFVREIVGIVCREAQKDAVSGTQQAPEKYLADVEPLWARLRQLSPAAQRKLVSETPEYHIGPLACLLCRKSIQAAASDPRTALRCAELAVLIARTVRGKDQAEGSQAEPYALAHLANALRVKGDLPAADRTFGECDRLWQPGTGSLLYDDATVYALKASLRRTQGRFEEAVDLHDKALRAAGAQRIRPELLLSKAYTLDEAGDLEGTISVLKEASLEVTEHEDERLLLSLHHNLADALSKAGLFEEAQARLGEVRRLVQKTGTDLDFARFQWVSGRIAGGLGRLEEAVTLLLQARGMFSAKGLAFEMALVSLELAFLYSQAGRTEAVKDIARNLAPLFQAQALPRETLAALGLFRQAAEAGRASAELAKQVLSFVRRARHDPRMVFTPI